MKQHRWTLFAGALALATACTDSIGPIQAVDYPLVSVNATAVPAPHPEMNAFEVVAGRLTLHRNGTAEEAITIRCRADLPADHCHVSLPTQTRTGTYSEAEGRVSFSGRDYPAHFEADRVTVEYGPPPSAGVFARATFVYAR
jgi:hypothetical protein